MKNCRHAREVAPCEGGRHYYFYIEVVCPTCGEVEVLGGLSLASFENDVRTHTSPYRMSCRHCHHPFTWEIL